MKNGNAIIRNGLALLLCHISLFCSLRAVTFTGEMRYWANPNVIQYTWEAHASAKAEGSVITLTWQGSGQGYDTTKIYLQAGINATLKGPNNYSAAGGYSFTGYINEKNASFEFPVKTYTYDLKSKPAGIYQIVSSDGIVVAVYQWDGTEIADYDVTGKITGFRDGKWYAEVITSNLKQKVTVSLYQVGWKAATLQIVNPGRNEIYLEPSPIQEDYVMQLKDDTLGKVLDSIDVPYTPAKVQVFANLDIANPAGVINPDAFVRVNGETHEPGKTHLVQVLQLGGFSPGETIPVIFGSGVIGSNFVYTVPNKPGEYVSFNVAGSVKDNSGPPIDPPIDPEDPVDPVDPVDPNGGGGGEPKPPKPEDPEGPKVEPKEPPIVPPEPPVVPPENPTGAEGNGDVVNAIGNLGKIVSAEAETTRTLSADGFNKVLNEIHNGTVTNAEGLTQVIKAVQDTEYAVRDEGVKTRNLTADQFNKLITAINTGNLATVAAIEGSKFDDGRMVAATNEVRDELKEINEKLGEKDDTEGKLEESAEGTVAGMQDLGKKHGDKGKENAGILSAMFNIGDAADTDDSFLASYQPAASWSLGKFEVPNPFFPTSKWGRVFTMLFRIFREIMIWIISFWFMREIWKLVTKEVTQIMMIPGQSGTTATVVASGAGGLFPAVGALAGAGAQIMCATLLCVFIVTLPLFVIGFLESDIEAFSDMKKLFRMVLSGPMGTIKSSVNSAGDGAPILGQAFWYANQILPLALGFAAPVYLFIVKVATFPTRFLARMFIKIFQSL